MKYTIIIKLSTDIIVPICVYKLVNVFIMYIILFIVSSITMITQ